MKTKLNKTKVKCEWCREQKPPKKIHSRYGYEEYVGEICKECVSDIKSAKKQKQYPPSPAEIGSVRIAMLDDDDIEIYKKDPTFQKFKQQNKLAIYGGNELWAFESDMNIIKKYGDSQ